MAGWLRRTQSGQSGSTSGNSQDHQAELLARVQAGVKDLAGHRDRIEQSLRTLANSQAELTLQAEQARRLDREDLAQLAESKAAELRQQEVQLASQFYALRAEEQKLLDAARRLDSRLGGGASVPMSVIPDADAPVGERNSRTIPQDVKIRVAARDGGKCRQCSSSMELHFDHVVPWSRGGANTVQNIQLLCGPCNRRKGAKGVPADI
jgi:hypothetical protein